MPSKTTCALKLTRSLVQRYSAVALLVALGWSAYGCGDTASISDGPEVRLSSLGVTPGSLSPAFSPTTTQYSVNLPASATDITVTATPEDGSAQVTISGGATQTLPGPGSSKDITILLTAQSGSQSTYTITVRKAELAGDNDLKGLTVTPGTLSPGFAAATRDYAVDVGPTVTAVSVSASKSDPNAVMSGSVTAGSGIATGQASIALGGVGTATPITITVVAQNGNAKTYAITVNRQPPPSNSLSALTVSSGILSPTFAPSTLTYGLNVPAANDVVSVTATKTDPEAVMSIGGVNIGAGTATGQKVVPLNPPGGVPTTVSITVTSPGLGTKTYTLVISRPPR